MNANRITMLEPSASGSNVFSLVRQPRLGLPILGTLAARRGHQVRVVIEDLAGLDLARLLDTDLLCISTISTTAPRAYQVADQARAAGVPVLLGGPHPTFLPEEGLAHADWVLRGEAERSFGRFLDLCAGRAAPEEVPGLSRLCDGAPVHTPLAEEPVELDEVPIPDFSLLATRGKVRFDRGIIPLQTSRGCPHQCRFCSVTSMFGRKMRFASPEHVAEELEQRRGQGRRVFFYDDNFCGVPGRTKLLLEHLLRRGTYLPPWYAQVSTRAAKDPELLDLMRRAGCEMVFVGFESIDPAALALYDKRQSAEDIRESIRSFRARGIWVHGMFLTGSDAEGLENIRATARFAIQEDIDSIQFTVLTPMPGSEFHDQMVREERLLTLDWSRYDGHHAVFRPARLSAEELEGATIDAMAEVYSLGRTLGLLARGRV
ncbi:MAG TPA: radical SAM protein [Myxococcota bacterium]|nr:radical SAM protein [Myxococcota bacterium]HRY92742.1 radical SAM protein [Myxococcota bacterium]HSA20716.1 radical SAM protein [Myxococcota bacterium]